MFHSISTLRSLSIFNIHIEKQHLCLCLLLVACSSCWHASFHGFLLLRPSRVILATNFDIWISKLDPTVNAECYAWLMTVAGMLHPTFVPAVILPAVELMLLYHEGVHHADNKKQIWVFHSIAKSSLSRSCLLRSWQSFLVAPGVSRHHAA